MSESPTIDRKSGWLALFGVVATLALVFAFSAVVLAGGDEEGAAAGTGATGPVHVALSEFAVEPAVITVPQGGSLHVQNDGSTTHNLAIVDQDLATADLPAGGSEELDVSSLEVGTYDVLCQIPGHADSGMTGTLEVTADEGGTEAATTDTSMAGMDHGSGDMMTEADYQRMSDAMDASIGEFPAETEGVGNQELEPTVLRDGTKHFEITAAITDWEVSPGHVVQAWTYNGMVPGPQMHVDVGDRVEIELHNELPAATDVHLHGVNVPNSMDGVAPITQDRVEPGESFTYAFTADEVSVAMYHAHHMADMTVPNGLLGMFYVGDVPMPAGQTIGDEVVPADLEISQHIPDGPQRRRGHRLLAERQELPRHVTDRGQRRGLGRDHLRQRGHADPPHAPAPVRPDRGRRGRLPARPALRGRHPQRRPRPALHRPGPARGAGHLGLALPHPPPRRERGRHVRHGHRGGRRVVGFVRGVESEGSSVFRGRGPSRRWGAGDRRQSPRDADLARRPPAFP
jgi:plastocyanin